MCRWRKGWGRLHRRFIRRASRKSPAPSTLPASNRSAMDARAIAAAAKQEVVDAKREADQSAKACLYIILDT